MKPLISWNAIVVTTCLSAVGFFSGCATPKMEGQLLRQCIQRGDTDGAVKLVNSGVLDGKDNGAVYGEYLYYAALKNDTNVVLALLARGANPNWTGWVTPVGQTPVSAAARTRSAEALRILIEHGGSVLESGPNYKEYLTPFEVSVVDIEAPGTVTDLLIEAGAKPREKSNSAAAAAGTHWATASYDERHGDVNGAVVHYQKAAEFYDQAARQELGLERFLKFMNSPFMRSALVVGNFALGSAVNSPTGVAVNNVSPGSTPFDPLAPKRAEVVKGNIASLHDKAERYAAYSKLLRDHSKELVDQEKQ